MRSFYDQARSTKTTIYLNVNPTNQKLFEDCGTAFDAWNVIEKTFRSDNRASHLPFNASLRNGLYYADVKVIKEDFEKVVKLKLPTQKRELRKRVLKFQNLKESYISGTEGYLTWHLVQKTTQSETMSPGGYLTCKVKELHMNHANWLKVAGFPFPI